MGIRINKDLGWVLIGEELNIKSLEKISLRDLKNLYPQDYELNNLDLAYPELNLDDKISNFINNVCDDEDRNDKMYILSPPFVSREWHRHDEAIDYYDSESMERKLKFIHGEIFPYAQKFVVSRTLKELSNIQKEICWSFSNSSKTLKIELRNELKSLGLDLSKPLREQIHMTCPHIIRLFLEQAGYTNYKSLRPALVTYWR